VESDPDTLLLRKSGGVKIMYYSFKIKALGCYWSEKLKFCILPYSTEFIG
jgi:hypothetical protein